MTGQHADGIMVFVQDDYELALNTALPNIFKQIQSKDGLRLSGDVKLFPRSWELTSPETLRTRLLSPDYEGFHIKVGHQTAHPFGLNVLKREWLDTDVQGVEAYAEGVIMDRFGFAVFGGNIIYLGDDISSVKFVKQYIAPCPAAIKVPISYSGKNLYRSWKEEASLGDWTTLDTDVADQIIGRFQLRKNALKDDPLMISFWNEMLINNTTYFR